MNEVNFLKIETKLEKIDEKLDQIQIHTALFNHRITLLEEKVKEAEKDVIHNRRAMLSAFFTATVSLLLAGFKYISGGQ